MVRRARDERQGWDMNLPEKRHTVESLFAWKSATLSKMADIQRLDNELTQAFELICGYSPVRLDMKYANFEKNRDEKYVDYSCWNYLIRIFYLERYMLCTDYEKLKKEIEDFQAPQFTIENANAWIASLKSLIYENVNTLVKKVFASLTEGAYYTGGSSYSSRAKKKRNNNGVDASFILSSGDNYRLHYYSDRPTITDDLEKVCYILAGKPLPEVTAIRQMYNEKTTEYSNDLFSIKVCKNGNTHYAISEDIREKLNRFGPTGAIIAQAPG
jgi:hypothetical protein